MIICLLLGHSQLESYIKVFTSLSKTAIRLLIYITSEHKNNGRFKTCLVRRCQFKETILELKIQTIEI